MRLEHEPSGEVVLYDDHGVGWVVTLARDEQAGPAGGAPRAGSTRMMRFRAPGADPLVARYEGHCRDEATLELADVVPPFLEAAG